MAANTTGFDASPFVKELGRVFGEYRQYNTRSNAVLLNHTADRLAGDLFNAAASLRSSQQAKIEGVPAAHDYHVKRRLARNVGHEAVALRVFKKGKRKGQFKSESIASQIRRKYGRIIAGPHGKTRQLLGLRHVSVEDEITLRKRFAALFQASGWLYKGAQGARGFRIMQPPCVVIKELEGGDLHVSLTNPRPNSAEFAENTGYLEPAFQARIADMYRYIARKIYEEARMFNRPRPNFTGVDIAAEVEAAMAGRAA